MRSQIKFNILVLILITQQAIFDRRLVIRTALEISVIHSCKPFRSMVLAIGEAKNLNFDNTKTKAEQLEWRRGHRNER